MPSDQLPKQIEKKEKEPIDIKPFLKELSFLISKRKNGDIQKTMFDLTLIEDINDLTEEDARMWYKVNNYESNPISREEFSSYQKSIEDSKNPSRYQFSSFLTQKISSIWLNKETKEYYGKKHKSRTKRI